MFDIHQSVFDSDGEWDGGLAEEYSDGLMTAFAESPEGIAFEEHYGEIGWPHSFLYCAQTYLGTTPPEMSPRDVAEVLFELFPRKVSVEAEAAGEIIAEMRAFWEFLGREYELPNAAGIVADLGRDAAARLKRELSDSSNFGMAKSFFTMGRDAGFDMTSEAGLAQFTLAYNEAMLAARRQSPDGPQAEFDEPRDVTNTPRPSFNVTPELRQRRKKQRRKTKQRKSKRSRR
jgi:hypothetical protein